MSSRDRSRVLETLQRFVVTEPLEQDTELLDLGQAAARLQESPTSIELWIADKRLLAWREDQTLRIPAERRSWGRIESCRVSNESLKGCLPRGWPGISSGSNRRSFPVNRGAPLDALKAGQIEDVIHAIRSHGEAFT